MPKKTINFGARFEYLSAIEVHWPDVMKSLQLDAFPVYQECLASTPATELQTLAGLSDALERGASHEIREVDLAVRAWAEKHSFQDDWLRDVALQSMHGWARGGTRSKWTYLPDELNIPKFEPSFGYWIPGWSTWPDFTRRTYEHFRRALAEYRAQVRTLWGESHPKLRQSAVWTVLWQRGRSPEAIQNHHRKTTEKNVSLANIQQRVHDFAGAAGLSLRASRTRPP
jgi:hypothetical protein